MFIDIPFTVAERWKPSKCPLVEERLNDVCVCVCVDYYSAFKRKKILTQATAWMYFEDIM